MKKVIFLLLAIILLMSGCVYSNNTTDINSGITTNISNEAFISYFLHDDILTGLPYASREMRTTFDPSEPIETITYVSLPNGNTSISNWTSPALNTTLIPHGVHTLHLHALKIGGSGAHTTSIYFQCGTVNSTGGDLMIHGTSEFSTPVLTTLPSTEFSLDILMPDINTNLTDRMAVFVYANQTGTGALPNLQLQFDDLTDSRMEFRELKTLVFINGVLNSTI